MSSIVIIIAIILYMALLFFVAFKVEKNEALQSRLLKNPYVYSLSLAVYCSAWTFFGSIGMASNSVLEYATIYIGPTIMAPLFWVVLRKLIRISKIQSINTLSDLISARYGKNMLLGRVASIFLAISVIPYIALQIKAVDLAFDTFFSWDSQNRPETNLILKDSGFYFTLVMGAFILLFTTRRIQSKNQNSGLVSAVVVESIVKLVAFITVGLFIVYGINDGVDNAMSLIPDDQLKLNQNESYSEWFGMIFLSGIAFMLLPRQFEMAVVENVSEKHLSNTMWLLPLYFLLINFLVLPVALYGNEIFAGSDVNSDMYLMAIPLQEGNRLMASLALLGGFAAASGMMIVSTHALSKMLSNSIIMPAVIDKAYLSNWFGGNAQRIPGFFRRVSIFLVLLLAYIYYALTTSHLPLVSIGLVSFVAVAQFAPMLFGGLFWKGGNFYGAITGLLIGFFLWFFHLVAPSISGIGFFPKSFIEWTIFGSATSQTGAITTVLFWSLLGNIIAYVFVSIFTKQTVVERNQAEIFVDVFKYSKAYESSVVWKGTAYFPDLKSLLEKFIGQSRTEEALKSFADKHEIDLQKNDLADGRMVTHAEKLLTAVIGAASAKIMVSTVVKEERIGMKDVVDILKESQELMRLNKELTRKSSELKRATEALQRANQKLKDNDELKDEFLYTVTHEMRTPLTSIRALSEILVDNSNEMPKDLQEEYTKTILKETERMSRLISQVLDLENFESGKHKLQIDYISIQELIEDSIDSMKEVFKKKKIHVELENRKHLPAVMGDYDRLMQVMLNLLSNAVKYVPEENGEIKVTAYQIENKIRVNIRDNGKGIPDDMQQIIFDKFFQARNQTVRKPKGSGLGLAICRKIIQLHDGHIWVESQLDKGSRFSFTIPIKTRY
ncbi:MAG: ATP-binding protein [Salibacter sp.]|uniref:ATP-binding protein n=1 Tax=Salibacter sp. TaxID=2010995 RepID=UPI0028703ABD|nr:ATP-binding protein [Salibacter sp.]MDR9398310.1 ATP-binding protein [Salibacter sp.]